MFIEALGQHVAVCSFEGATRLIRADKRYWNVVSICGPRDQKADFPLAKSIHHSYFDDVEDKHSPIYRSPQDTDIAAIFTFIRNLSATPPSQPLLIHCAQGISRSTAVALSWIYGNLPASDNRSARAIGLILELRPEAKPNRLVLTLGLTQFLGAEEARELAERMIAEPRLARNRFQSSETQ
jgi:predicted protein tyrosine phosphatase